MPTSVGAGRVTLGRTLLIFEPYPMGKGGGNLRTLPYLLEHLDRTRFSPLLVAPVEAGVHGAQARRRVRRVSSNRPSVGRYAGQVLRDTWWRRLRSALDLLRYNLTIAAHQERVSTSSTATDRRCSPSASDEARGRPVLWYIKGALENGLLDRLGFFVATGSCSSPRQTATIAIRGWCV